MIIVILNKMIFEYYVSVFEKVNVFLEYFRLVYIFCFLALKLSFEYIIEIKLYEFNLYCLGIKVCYCVIFFISIYYILFFEIFYKFFFVVMIRIK